MVRTLLAALFLLACGQAALAQPRILEVGAGRAFAQPSAAAAVARTGDTIRIAAGTYRDCAVWRADGLVIEGAGAEATVIAGRTCQGKGIFVITSRDVTVRGLSLSGARVPDANGAGIRAEGGSLTVEGVHFLDNENGILFAGVPGGRLVVRGSVFRGNGSCERACAHGIYVGPLALLRVERSRFEATRSGHHIKSRALVTEILDSDIADGADGTASYLIDIPNGGAVLVRGNRLQKGPRAANRSTAIIIGAEGVDRPTPEILIEDNRFVLEGSYRSVFVTNHTATPARLIGNTLQGAVQPLRGDGTVAATGGVRPNAAGNR
jgi:hypothetical protein